LYVSIVPGRRVSALRERSEEALELRGKPLFALWRGSVREDERVPVAGGVPERDVDCQW
jgi:hypothetical protein